MPRAQRLPRARSRRARARWRVGRSDRARAAEAHPPAEAYRLTTAAGLDDSGGWPSVLGSLIARVDLTSASAYAAMSDVLVGRASPAQLAALLVALRMKGETVEEMDGLLRAMIDASVPVTLPVGLTPVDTCGTGGVAVRREAAFNVSTLAALVVAGAGATVCKHGNRAASSTSGSADLLEALGVVVDLGPEGVARCVADAGIGFCFAPRFHPAMRHAGPTRRELGVPTVFNVLGPLANPAGVQRQLVGVARPEVAEKVVGVLAARGAERALVVYGHDGLDELTTATTSTVLELRDGEVRSYVIDPSDLGIAVTDRAGVRGGDAAANARFAHDILGGGTGPRRDLVQLNAAAGLVAAQVVDTFEEGFEAAGASIDSGAAGRALDRLVAASNQAASDDGATPPH